MHSTTLAAPGQVRANVGTDSSQGVGDYVAKLLDPWTVTHADRPFPLPHTTPLFSRCRFLRCFHRPPPLLLARMAAVLLHSFVPRMCTLPTRHICQLVWWCGRFLQSDALASLCKCASVQVCPFDASPSQIPLVGAPVGRSVAVGAMKLQLQLQLQL